MEKQITLTKTQFFLRFLKKNNIYHKYQEMLHKSGKIKWEHALEISTTNPCHHLLPSMSMKEILWDEMLRWRGSNDNSVLAYWNKIDDKWCILYRRYLANSITESKKITVVIKSLDFAELM